MHGGSARRPCREALRHQHRFRAKQPPANPAPPHRKPAPTSHRPPATARASSVFPVPGGPTSSTPEGGRAPSLVNFSGNLRNSCSADRHTSTQQSNSTERRAPCCSCNLATSPLEVCHRGRFAATTHHNLLELFLRLVHPCHILKRHRVLQGEEAGMAAIVRNCAVRYRKHRGLPWPVRSACTDAKLERRHTHATKQNTAIYVDLLNS